MRRTTVVLGALWYLLAFASPATAETWILWTEKSMTTKDGVWTSWKQLHWFSDVVDCQRMFITTLETHKRDPERYTLVQDTVTDNQSLTSRATPAFPTA